MLAESRQQREERWRKSHRWDGPTISVHTADVRTCSLCGADESEQTPCLPEDDIVRRLIGVSVSLGLEWTPEYRQNVFDTCREAAKAIKQLRRRSV